MIRVSFAVCYVKASVVLLFLLEGEGGGVMYGYALVMLGLCVLVGFYAKVSISFG